MIIYEINKRKNKPIPVSAFAPIKQKQWQNYFISYIAYYDNHDNNSKASYDFFNKTIPITEKITDGLIDEIQEDLLKELKEDSKHYLKVFIISINNLKGKSIHNMTKQDFIIQSVLSLNKGQSVMARDRVDMAYLQYDELINKGFRFEDKDKE